VDDDKSESKSEEEGEEKSSKKEYSRQVPSKYQKTSTAYGTQGGGDDFMSKMIKEYAIEGGKDKGEPNGQFWFEPEGARKAAKQVLMDYMHHSEAEAEDEVCQRFNHVWMYYDPHNTGKIDADRMPRLFRELAGAQLNLQ